MTAATGTKIDTRDGKVYKTVLMPDGKWWSAENLAWAGAGVSASGSRYYGAGEITTCAPVGSHIPLRDEWQTLYDALPTPKGGQLKSTSGWDTTSSSYPSVQGLDTYGFNAQPLGNYTSGLNGVPIFAYLAIQPSGGTWGSAFMRAHENDTLELTAGPVSDSTKLNVRFIVDSGNVPDTAPTPRIYPASGTLQGVQFVTIKGQGTLRYTLDGSEPSASSPIYTGPIRLSSPTTVKARAYVAPLESLTDTATLDIQGAVLQAIPSYRDRVMPYLLEQYKGDNP